MGHQNAFRDSCKELGVKADFFVTQRSQVRPSLSPTPFPALFADLLCENEGKAYLGIMEKGMLLDYSELVITNGPSPQRAHKSRGLAGLKGTASFKGHFLAPAEGIFLPLADGEPVDFAQKG